MKITTQSDLQNLINNQIEESLILEYKAAPALENSQGKKKEMSKDISAMANSNGGTIIYGIAEFQDEQRKHLPERIDSVDRTKFSKEWIEQVINSNISPRINGIVIHSIQLTSGTNDVVYVIDIPQSDTAHQANDLKYYKRFNFQSVAMYDYEIKDVMNRLTHPVIDLTFEIEKRTFEVGSNNYFQSFNQPKPKEYKTIYELKVWAKNNGRVYANYINSNIYVPDVIVNKDANPSNDMYAQFYAENTIRDLFDVEWNGVSSPKEKYGPARYDPILPGRSMKIETIKILNPEHHLAKEVSWRLNADNSPERTGKITISEIPITEIE
jgi:hypothetical protein